MQPSCTGLVSIVVEPHHFSLIDFFASSKTTTRSNQQPGKGAYEGDGKTSVTLLNKEHDLGLMINSYSQYGFRLNNSLFVLGPMAIFPKTVLSWNVESLDDINAAALSLVTVLEPKVDILILGLGDADVTPEFSKKILTFVKHHRINVEVLRTETACATFNFLNAESRMVAGLIIPPLHLRVNEDDLMKRTTRGNYFKLSDDDDFDIKQLPNK